MIEVKDVSKWFGAREVLRNISFQVEKGEVLGFLGPNGAGKTTTLRILTGFFLPDRGEVKIGGYSIAQNPLAVKRNLGYFPEHNPLYPEMTVEGFLRFVARIKGVEAKKETREVNKVMADCNLENVRHRLIKRLSKGYRQRVGLAQALLNEPQVLLLDEPTIGLDPKQIYEIRQLIKGLAAQKTVVLSTHILPEVSMVCTKVVIINNGQVVAKGSPEDLTAQKGYVELLVRAPYKEFIAYLEGIPEVNGIEAKAEDNFVRAYIHFDPQSEIRPRIVQGIVQQGWELLELIPRQKSLEEVFVQLVTAEAS